MHVFHIANSVDDHENPQNLTFNCLQTLEDCHDKVVNECAMLDYDRVVTCSREPIVKIFDIGGDGSPIA